MGNAGSNEGSQLKRTGVIYGLIILEVIIAALGIASGISLLMDPSGVSMGLDVVKDKIPFQNLFLLGLWFIGPYGVVPVALAYGVWTAKTWAWKPSLGLALIEIIWVLIQIPMVGLSIMQAVIGFIALATIYLLYNPYTKKYLGV